MQWIQNLFEQAQGWVFQFVVQPILYSFGMGGMLEDAYVATGWLLVGLIQIAVMLAIIGPLQRWRPADARVDTAEVRTDVVYTLLHRLGIFRVALFFSVEPLFDQLFGYLRVAGLGTVHIDQLMEGVTDHPMASFLIYLVVFDFFGYWIHRAQHRFEWWWSLHALHHSQRSMTMWSDNRNHLLDDVIRDSLLVVLGQLIGVGPGQFVGLVAIAQLSESFQHANLRLHFGLIGERLWVSPRFHRLHHSIGLGHEDQEGGEHLVYGQSPALGGHNFGVLLPWWDMMFGTANFEIRFDPTGIRDQVETGRDYGRGFWEQQKLGVLRLMGRA
ncbi:sterol desaturase family protein [Ramlibacter monticola]|uniref:Sterol desaturase family protein n=1 Tax=Ramlibacter monticola TaxID=1926872 RepID=A0A937CVP9_9BURK|nr:sterol desaturase family protein [Ramlibacter monticola]MBL0395040.1 sterol desaturase family protein [Ramlibacter monticola]